MIQKNKRLIAALSCVAVLMILVFYNLGRCSIYKQINGIPMTLTSGMGSWEDTMIVSEDGSFSGIAYDVDPGLATKDYPNGVQRYCKYRGILSRPCKLNDFQYDATVESLEFVSPIGTTEICDGYLFDYEPIQRIMIGERVVFYTPGTPMIMLSEDLNYWLWWRLAQGTTTVLLPYYVMAIDDQGFMENDAYE